MSVEEIVQEDHSVEAVNEDTPLISHPIAKPPDLQGHSHIPVLICAFAISLSITLTRVPMLFLFRTMACDQYYKTHPFDIGQHRNCSTIEIDTETAKAVTLLGTTTTISGTFNLLVSTWMIKRLGVKVAMINQAVWPTARLGLQLVAIKISGEMGILMIQLTQFICVLGGSTGYVLVSNTFISRIVTDHKATPILGILQGCIMFGNALGYLCGGVFSDIWGIKAPYQIGLVLMFLSMVYATVCLPSTPAIKATNEKTSGFSILNLRARIMGPIRIFGPQYLMYPDGKVRRQYGVPLLCLGVFLGVLATGFMPILLQMYTATAFDFSPTENGYLMAFNFIIRGLFLSFGFPKIITSGRKWLLGRDREIVKHGQDDIARVTHDGSPSNTTSKNKMEVPRTSAFDLIFLKASLVVDGLLTGLTGFSKRSWHVYLAAFLLPLASGSAPAAKGVMMDMCAPWQRDDALSAISVVEMIGTISTMSLFGAVYASLAAIGKPNLIFFCNAGVAVLAVLILAFSVFPPEGCSRLSNENLAENEPPQDE